MIITGVKSIVIYMKILQINRIVISILKCMYDTIYHTSRFILQLKKDSI